MDKNFVQLSRFDRFSQESIHACLQGLPLERRLRISCATTQERHILLVKKNALCEKSSDLNSDLRSIHFWHAIVKKDYLVHGCFSLVHKLQSLLDGFESLGAFHGIVTVDGFALEHGSKHLNIHHVIIDYKNSWMLFFHIDVKNTQITTLSC